MRKDEQNVLGIAALGAPGMNYELAEEPCNEEVKYIAKANDRVIGTLILRYIPEIYPGCLVMTFIEVDEDYRGGGLGSDLFQVAGRYAVDRGHLLIPSPDLLWDGFRLWMNRDWRALAYVLMHPSSRDLCADEGGDLERFEAQADKIRQRILETGE
ncbi:MAG: GNAT family N-acetyltransferase [Hyphomicrobium sp.]